MGIVNLVLIMGIAIGLFLGYVIAYLMLKSKNISKNEYNSLIEKSNAMSIELGIEKEKNTQSLNIIKQVEDELTTKTLEFNQLISSNADYKSKLESANEIANENKADLHNMKNELEKRTNEYYELKESLSGVNEQNKVLNEKLKTQKDEMEEMAKKFNLEFENIANKIFEEKTQKFTEQNKTNLDDILKPLKENISQFKTKVEEVYDKESKERFSLSKEVQSLVEMNKIISDDANNLTRALKGESKTQGDWGEMILVRILEQSGLRENEEYFVQEFLKDADGNNIINEHNRKMQPDVIIHFPGERKVIVDSKVSLTAFSNFVGTEEIEEQQDYKKAHLTSVKKHIDELSAKNYQDYTTSLDYVMMFMPSESAYMLAMQSDKNLWEYAYNKKIIFISPTNLIASLKMIEDLWKREYQSQNAQDIADRGASLYDKFVGFVDNLEKVGKNINDAQKSYNSAFGQLSTGRGNLISQAEKLKELGVKSKKSLPSEMVKESLEEGNKPNID